MKCSNLESAISYICKELSRNGLGSSIFGLLALELLELPSLTIQFSLISVDLLLLVRLFYFVPLKLVADESARTQTEHTADRCSCARMPNRRTNDSARRR